MRVCDYFQLVNTAVIMCFVTNTTRWYSPPPRQRGGTRHPLPTRFRECLVLSQWLVDFDFLRLVAGLQKFVEAMTNHPVF